jgi:hypothetical protein
MVYIVRKVIGIEKIIATGKVSQSRPSYPSWSKRGLKEIL